MYRSQIFSGSGGVSECIPASVIPLLLGGPGQEASSVIWHWLSKDGTSSCSEGLVRFKEENSPPSGWAVLENT